MDKPFAVQGINVVSPKGQALWCKVAQPDRKYDAKGKFETSVVLDPTQPDVQAFVERLEALQNKAYDESKKTLKGKVADSLRKRAIFADEYINDEPTGNIILKVALKGVDDRAANGKQAEIVVVDAHKKPVSPVPLVGNGSTIRVVAFAYPYHMSMTNEIGLSLMWKKLQIIELKEFSAKSSDSDFDDEEGFEASSAPVAPERADDDF